MVPIAKTPAILSSEILIKSSTYTEWFILVEGDFDQRFWSTRLNASNLRLVNCVGKSNVLGTLDLLTSQNQAQKIIALADKDYDQVLMRLKQHTRLTYTDQNDLEVTLLRCPSLGVEPALERILWESIDDRKRKSFEGRVNYSVVDYLRMMAASYGVLRLINEQLQSGVNFDSLPILHADFLDKTLLMQNQAALNEAFINAVNQAGKVRLTKADFEAQIDSHRISGLFAGWELVQGHDLMQLLAIAINSSALKSEVGHQQINEGRLARDLCLMLHKHDLEVTNMFQDLLRQGRVAGLEFFN